MGEFSIGSIASDSTIDQFIGGKEMAKMKMLLVDD